MKLTRKKNPCNKKRGKGEKDWRSADGTNTHKKHLGSSNQANQDIKCLVHFLCVCRDFFFCVNATRCCYYCSLNRNKQWIPKCGDNKKKRQRIFENKSLTKGHWDAWRSVIGRESVAYLKRYASKLSWLPW